MGTKSDISLLQEVLILKNQSPSYELLSQEVGSHMNKFVYQVQCDGLTVIGDQGRSKQIAKTNAARAMLEMISAKDPQLMAIHMKTHKKLDYSPPKIVNLSISNQRNFNNNLEKLLSSSKKENILANLKDKLDFNFIAELNEFCQKRMLPAPQYSDIEELSINGQKEFWIRCVLSDYETKGSGVSKKAAKHAAARKMYETMMDPEKTKNLETEEKISEKRQITAEKAFQHYKNIQMRKQQAFSKLDGVEISEWFKEIKKMFKFDRNGQPFEPLGECVIQEDSKLDFEDLLRSLNLDYELKIVQNKGDQPYVCIVSSHTCPKIVEMGGGKTLESAKATAISAFIDTVMTFLN